MDISMYNNRVLADVAVRVSGVLDSGIIEEATLFLNKFPLLSRSGYFKSLFLKMAQGGLLGAAATLPAADGARTAP